jgi:predicted Rossmann fold flavoprotein
VNVTETDVLIIGAGAAGLLCGIEAGNRGRRVVVLDHANKPAEKIRISGGGRCNFTNLHCSPEHFLSQNPRFPISALARYTPSDFLSLVQKHRIAYHEKTLGQLFCDDSSHQIIRMLLEEGKRAGVDLKLQTRISEASQNGRRFVLHTDRGVYSSESLVIASGGLSIPKMGATGLGYDIAKKFGISLVPTSAGLVPLVFKDPEQKLWSQLSGVSLRSRVSCGGASFTEGLLFTHKGLSGPSILQCSSYWRPGESVSINLVPDHDIASRMIQDRHEAANREVAAYLADILPKRLGHLLCEQKFGTQMSRRMAQVSNDEVRSLARMLNDWNVVPAGTEGYRVAEVTLGGVNTKELDSKTMMSKKVSNLFFIGEVVDVTGHLGGFNFQWAWSSGYVAGQYA